MIKPLEFTKDEYGYLDPSPWYDTLIESFAEIVSTRELGSYQGDLVYVLKRDDGEFGVLIVGYGSCSGCDALQACGNLVDKIIQLRDSIAEDVVWGKEAIETRDWEGATWALYDPEVRRALFDAIEDIGATPPFSREEEEDERS